MFQTKTFSSSPFGKGSVDVSKLIGKVLKDPPKGVERLSDQLLFRSGNFLWTDAGIVSMAGGHRILCNIVNLLAMGQPLRLAEDSLRQVLFSEFNSYKSLPNAFYIQSDYQLKVFIVQNGVPDDYFDKFDSLGLHSVFTSDGLDRAYLLTEGDGREYLFCQACGYRAMPEAAEFGKDAITEPLKEIKEVATPNCKTIDEVSGFLNVPVEKTAKAVFFTRVTDGSVIFVVVRGDFEVNLPKLEHHFGELRPSTDDEIRACGSVPGYASPINVSNCTVVVDPSVEKSSNLVAGANREGFHLVNTNYGRDYKADMILDVALAKDGYPCKCGGFLSLKTGNVIGSISQHLTDVPFMNEKGKKEFLKVTEITIDMMSIVRCVADQNHDQYGVIFPPAVAPWKYIVLVLDPNEVLVSKITKLLDSGTYLIDGRKAKPGVKFSEADLRGIPNRIVISKRLGDKIEVKRRGEEKMVLSLEEFTDWLLEN